MRLEMISNLNLKSEIWYTIVQYMNTGDYNIIDKVGG